MHPSALFALAGVGISLLCSLPHASAADCPALRTVDIATHVQGMEVVSNSTPAEFGVRLSWENPVENTPTRTYIYRKQLGKPFEKIGQTSTGTQKNYLDKTISKTVPAYAYVLKTEFTCGGTLWSEPITVLTGRRAMDTSAPLVQFVMPKAGNNVGANEDMYIYAKDTDSAIISAQFKLGTATIATGSNLGTPLYALYRISGSSLAEKATDLKVTLTNGGDMKTDKTVSVAKGAAARTVAWTGPLAGSAFDTRMPLDLSWSIEDVDAADAANVRLTYSTNFGVDWLPLDAPTEGTSDHIDNPAVTFKGIRNAGILWLRLSYDDGENAYGSSLLPLFVSQTTVHFTSPSNFLGVPGGTFSLYDALKGTKISFPAGTPSLDDTDPSKIKISDREAIVALKPGFYGVEEAMDNFVLTPANPSSAILFTVLGESLVNIPLYPYTQFLQDRTALSPGGEQIISGNYDPQELIDANKQYENKKNVKPVEQVTSTTPTPVATIVMRLTDCMEGGTCRNFTYSGASPLKLSWDASQRAFGNTTGSGTAMNTSPLLSNKMSWAVDGLSLHMPSVLFSELPLSSDDTFQVTKTSTGLRWDMPSQLTDALRSMTGFAKASYVLGTGESCTNVLLERKDASGELATLPTLCATDKIVAVVLPYAQTEIQVKKVPQDVAVLQGSQWYVPYMNQFQLWEMLYKKDDITHAEEPLTRGELAYLLHKAFQYPTGVYQSNASFTDLPATHPFAPYILGMVSQSVMSGDAATNTIRPESTVNRAEALKMILVASHLDKATIAPRLAATEDTTYTDVPKDSWFANYVSRATSLHIVSGYMENNQHVFKPANQVTRAEALKMIYSSLEQKALE